MINSLVSYSLRAPYRRSLMLPPSRWRSFFELCSFGHCYGVFLRAGVCVLFGSCTTARLGVSYEVRRAHPPRTALCRADLVLLARCRRPSALSPLRGAGGRLGRSSVGAPPPFPRDGGRAGVSAVCGARSARQARIRAHPTLNKSTVHCLGSAVRRAPFGVLHSAQLARSLAPLPRSRSAVPPLSSLRSDNGATAPLCG